MMGENESIELTCNQGILGVNMLGGTNFPTLSLKAQKFFRAPLVPKLTASDSTNWRRLGSLGPNTYSTPGGCCYNWAGHLGPRAAGATSCPVARRVADRECPLPGLRLTGLSPHFQG